MEGGVDNFNSCSIFVKKHSIVFTVEYQNIYSQGFKILLVIEFQFLTVTFVKNCRNGAHTISDLTNVCIIKSVVFIVKYFGFCRLLVGV